MVPRLLYQLPSNIQVFFGFLFIFQHQFQFAALQVIVCEEEFHIPAYRDFPGFFQVVAGLLYVPGPAEEPAAGQQAAGQMILLSRLPQTLHGPVQHLLVDGQRLYAASELSGFLSWELGIFHQEYCQLLREVWAGVPLLWVEGLPEQIPPRTDHHCSQ